MSNPRPGRNDPCHCGKPKKYKNCCYERDHATVRTAAPTLVVEPDPTLPNLGWPDTPLFAVDLNRVMPLASAAVASVPHPAGAYSDQDDVGQILRDLFAHFHTACDHHLREVASVRVLGLLLLEYSKLVDLIRRSRKPDVPLRHASAMDGSFGIHQRLLKFLIERILLLSDDIPLEPAGGLIDGLHKAWYCGDQVLTLSIARTQATRLFPDQTTLIYSPDDPRLWSLNSRYYELFDNLAQRTMQDNRARAQALDVAAPPYDMRYEAHDVILAPLLTETIGVSYADALALLNQFTKSAMLPHEPGTIPIFPRREVLETLHQNTMTFGKGTITSATPASFESILDGFLLTADNMRASGDSIQKLHREYHARRRGVFELRCQGERQLLWSTRMAEEALEGLTRGCLFAHLPTEWKRPDKKVAAGEVLGQLQRATGKSLEDALKEALAEREFLGQRFYRTIGQGQARIGIPLGLDELDYFGYSPREKLLVFGECKMLDEGSEPGDFHDDVETFVNGTKPYAQKFRKRLQWICDNANAIRAALASVFNEPIDATHVAPVMVTYYPNIATDFIADFRCVCLSELLRDYDVQGRWPYGDGVRKCGD